MIDFLTGFLRVSNCLLCGLLFLCVFQNCKTSGEMRPNDKAKVVQLSSLYALDTQIKEVRVNLSPQSTNADWANYVWLEGYTGEVIPSLVYASRNNKGKWVRSGIETININHCEVTPNQGKNLSKPFQAIVNFAIAREVPNIFIPKGIYVLDQIFIGPGLHIYGEKGSEIKKIANATKSSRIFTTQKNAYPTAEDYPPLLIENLSFDGNRQQQGPYTAYQLEHQAIIFLFGNKKTKGRLKASINNCHFRDGVGDAISVYTNVDATISNCSAYDVFRGGVTITGGNSKVVVNNFKAGGKVHPTGIDVEVSGPGYNNIHAIDIEMNDITVDGDCDIGVVEGQFIGNRITCLGPPFNFNAKGGKIVINNSTFIGGGQKKSRIQFPKDITFNNCTFKMAAMPGEERLYATNVIWSTKQHHGTKQRLRFIDCQFESATNIPSKTITYGIFCHADKKEDDNLLSLEGCHFKSGFDYGLYLRQGGNVLVDDTKFDCTNGLRLWSVQNNKQNQTFSAELKNLKFGPNTKNELEYTESRNNQLLIEKTNLQKVKKVQKNRGKTSLIEK